MRTGRFFFLVALIVLMFFRGQICYADIIPVITLQNGAERYSIGGKVALLEDAGGELSFGQVLDLDTAFRMSKQENPVFGPSSSTVWCAFRLQNKSKENKWYLEVGNSYLNQAELYEQTANGEYRRIKTGTGEPFKDRSIQTNRIIIPLHIALGSEKMYYLRFQSRNILRFPLQISTMPALYERNHPYDLANGMYFGLMFSLVILNLFVYLSLRDKSYLLYILYILCLALDIASIRGYIGEWLPESFMWLVNNRIFSGLTIFFGVAFSNSFLGVKRQMPALYRWSYAIFASVIIIFFLSMLRLYVLSFVWMLLTLIPGFIYIYITGISAWRKGFKPALYLTIAYGAMGTGTFIYALKDNNLLPENSFTEGAMQWGSVTEALVLSFALASKFNYYKREKDEAQELAIKQANAFSQQLIQSQEYERKRIAAELHDSIGQSLILIKNKVLLLRKRTHEPHKVEQHAQDLTESVTHTINEIRAISYALRPFQLDMLGLTASVQSLVEEVAQASGIHICVEADNIDGLFPKEDEINLYRIVQECLSNIVKHSGASQARLSLSRNEQVVQLKIEDNGRGMSSSAAAAQKKTGFGLLGIQERINILAGNWLIKEAVPQGTIIHISIPLSVKYANA
ncbi:7TM diverse intracellular signaling domain-containing protein [Rhodocytophaga aerolata]|uniref:histidine kinase n=1 Tax=Rhodocytophaga aerolata TaxID=455078 RepID=A0ABT8RFE9_9BACT|nr:7TM diverse intracellular signaling domain-containing protein [Rhodocytophaga aerolata]MDO1449893.1 7TM diverse intracellular signaling domain-containing protein [Rhodocytophaga aerolata]